MIFVGLGLALAVVIAGAVLLAPNGRSVELPPALESYSPEDGATVLRQTQIVIDLEVGFDIELTVDGVVIPTNEIDVSIENGRFVWAPGPGKAFEEWAPGFHTAEVNWVRQTGFPEPGTLRWAFRIQ